MPAVRGPNARLWTSLPLAALQEIRAECYADDVQIDLEAMQGWNEDEVRAYFDSGGVVAPPPADDAAEDRTDTEEEMHRARKAYAEAKEAARAAGSPRAMLSDDDDDGA